MNHKVSTAALLLLTATWGCGQNSQPSQSGTTPPEMTTPTTMQPASAPAAATTQPDVHPIPAPTTQPSTQPAAELPRIDLDGLRGLVADAKAHHQVLVMDFWATWCGPCVEMFPQVHEAIASLGDRARLVSVTLDAPGQYEEHAISYLRGQKALNNAYLLVPDTDARIKAVEGISTQWKDLVVPAILIFDSDGNLKGQFVHNVDVDAVLHQAKALLASSRVDQP